MALEDVDLTVSLNIPKPCNSSTVQVQWPRAKSATDAQALLNTTAKQAAALWPDARGYIAAMYMMALNWHADAFVIIAWFAQHLPAWALNHQTAGDQLTIGMIGIIQKRESEFIQAFLDRTDFRVLLQDKNKHDLLWYAAREGRMDLAQAIVDHATFRNTMFGAAIEAADGAGHLDIVHMLQALQVERDVVHIVAL